MLPLIQGGYLMSRASSSPPSTSLRLGTCFRGHSRLLPLGAGSNLIRWDGTDRYGQIVGDGIYLVTVGALGHTERRPLAVVK